MSVFNQVSSAPSFSPPFDSPFVHSMSYFTLPLFYLPLSLFSSAHLHIYLLNSLFFFFFSSCLQCVGHIANLLLQNQPSLQQPALKLMSESGDKQLLQLTVDQINSMSAVGVNRKVCSVFSPHGKTSSSENLFTFELSSVKNVFLGLASNKINQKY